ncbi:MAG: hypothetical protein AVDCRST_MAG25-1737, partial [uncultured Rubrobacteraceae bacterium]
GLGYRVGGREGLRGDALSGGLLPGGLGLRGPPPLPGCRPRRRGGRGRSPIPRRLAGLHEGRAGRGPAGPEGGGV